MQVDWERVNSLDDILRAATTQCQKDAQHNLFLAYELPIGALTSPFVEVKRDEALKWVGDAVPDDFYFTHGQYFQGERGIKHIIDELKSKKTSRRALLSLLSMKEIIGSGDRAIPAFLILQFGIQGAFLLAWISTEDD